jgi:integrase
MAVLGLSGDTGITIGTLFEAYCDVIQDQLTAKSTAQRRKWGNQRKRAIANLLSVIGDKPLADLKHADAIRYREWWMRRVLGDGIDAGTANKDIGMLSSMTGRLDEHFRLGLDRPFANLRLKGAKKNRREPFSDEWIAEQLLADDAFSSLNKEARMVVYVLINTGLRLSEVVNLQPPHILLDHKVPHVSVAAVGREIKTKDSEREMPLVGCSLEAMKKVPEGFPRYRDNEDSLSATLNKYMKQNGLKETPAHTIYSLRHSFQDSLTAVEPPDRVVADLMGHKYVRPKYGRGASLEQKRKWLLKIAYAAPASLKAL